MINAKGKQLEVLALPATGHIVVLGTAGSGKTTIAQLRAINLANMPGEDKVLLVTFNGALVEYMKGIGEITRNLVVENYHKFARGYLDSRNKMPRYDGITGNKEREELIKSAVNAIRTLYPKEATLKRNIDFFIDEIKFIQEFGCDTYERYAQIERTGRSTANLKREKRKFPYQVYEKYLELRKNAGKKYDWYDLAMYVSKELDIDDSERRYKHIIVDEGQDFSPMMIKSLVKAIPDNGSFSFFGDVAQQIYGNRMSWKESGISLDKVWRFEENYRNPETVIKFAKEIEKSITNWKPSEYMVKCNKANAVGPKPVLIQFMTEEAELEWIVKKAIAEKSTSSVVIICRNRTEIGRYKTALKMKGISAIEINKNTPGYADKKQIYLSTFHSAKGLEFYNVFIPSLTADKWPDPDKMDSAEDKTEVYAEELKLLYVAVTRSKFGLFMSYSGTLTDLFPKNIDTVKCIKVKSNGSI